MGSPDSAAAPVRVLIVDDQPVFRDAACALVSATSGFEWIGIASSGEEGVEQAKRLEPDLVLMNVRMPGIGGVEAARRIASDGLPAVVVLITAEAPVGLVADGAAAEIVAKQKLSRKVLVQLWEEHREDPPHVVPDPH